MNNNNNVDMTSFAGEFVRSQGFGKVKDFLFKL